MNRHLAGAGISLLIASVAACSDRADQARAEEITRESVCSLDGMTLMDYPGPKGQVHFDQGPPEFHCDTVETLAALLRPEQQRHITAVFVQDMARADWDQPRGQWIDARAAFYVKDSKRQGSMGPTLASFAREEDARQFVGQYGGKVMRFKEITPDMVGLDGGVLRDQRM